jgi:hypothetical protein
MEVNFGPTAPKYLIPGPTLTGVFSDNIDFRWLETLASNDHSFPYLVGYQFQFAPWNRIGLWRILQTF